MEHTPSHRLRLLRGRCSYRRSAQKSIMQTTVRHYNHSSDYERVGQFLVKTYRTTGGHINWLQPRWEYMHYHPLVVRVDLDSIGVWEVDGVIVGVVHPEHSMGTAYFEVDPAYGSIKRDMLKHAEKHVSTLSDAPCSDYSDFKRIHSLELHFRFVVENRDP